MFYRPSALFQVNTNQVHNPNVASFHLASGGRDDSSCGATSPLMKPLKIERVVATISHHRHGSALLVSGNFNANLGEPEGHPHSEEIVVTILLVAP